MRTLRRHAQRRAPSSIYGYFFIEIFSGTESFANACRKMGFKVFTFDVLQGEAGDLRRRAVQDRIKQLIRSGMCLGLFTGTECTTFSISQMGALRSVLHPVGLPGLSDRLRAKVSQGNLLAGISFMILKYCYLYSVPFCWENPDTSYMWRLDQALRMSQWDGVQDLVVDACSFGAPWKKRTRFRFYRMPVAEAILQGHKCSPGRGGVCSFSGRPHLHLQGRDPSGVSRTKRASEYPYKMCKALATVFHETAFDQVLAHTCEPLMRRPAANR